ncbi:hypothetical protein DFH06DRAFT_1326948 [Mycena polygramma]|nr:hypothetical protein DFH06DRAFT_1326948 [Mycena polygramma]
MLLLAVGLVALLPYTLAYPLVGRPTRSSIETAHPLSTSPPPKASTASHLGTSTKMPGPSNSHYNSSSHHPSTHASGYTSSGISAHHSSTQTKRSSSHHKTSSSAHQSATRGVPSSGHPHTTPVISTSKSLPGSPTHRSSQVPSSSQHTYTSTHSSHPARPSVTSIFFNPNPVAPSGASIETVIGPGTTTTISVPSGTTVVPLASPSLFVTNTVSASLNGSLTVLHTVFSTVTQSVGITLGPGGAVIGTVPTSLSQPGFVSPVFNTNPLPPPGATQITFTGKSGFSTAIPVPTSSSTILIGAAFGGGSIVLGAGGAIMGPLPAGIAEDGGVVPVPVPPPEGDPEQHPTSTPTTSESHTASSSSASASSSATCSRSIPLTCDDTCGPDDSSQYFLDAGDADLDDTGTTRRWLLAKRAEERYISSGCANSKVTSKSSTGVSNFESSGGPNGREYLTFTSPKGNSFAISQSIVSGPKPRQQGYITEHIFEFQIFIRFMVQLRAKNGVDCTEKWLEDFLDQVQTPEIQDIVNRIDSTPNMVYTNYFINSAKEYIIADVKQVGGTGLGKNWNKPDARERLEEMMRGLLAVPGYLDSNAIAFQSTASDILTLLQKYEIRNGTGLNPPMSVQFYNFLVADVGKYRARGKALGRSLAQGYQAKMTPLTPCSVLSDIDAVSDALGLA